MFIKPSHMLVAAMAVIAAPAFAQDATEAPANEITSPLTTGADAAAAEAKKAGEAVGKAVNNAGDSADAAAKDAAAAIEDAMPAEEQAPAGEADSTATEGEAATSETETPAPEAEGAPANTDATPADAGQGTAPAAADAESGEPKPGQYYAKSEHSDWTIRCIKADKGVDPCELYQLMNDEQGNSVAEVIIIPLSNGDVAAGATVVAPLQTDLIKGLSLSIDGGEARGYPFSFCAPVGCFSRMGFTAAELSALKRGGGAQIALLPYGADPSKPVALKLSLSGFTAAFDELSKIAKEAQEAAPEATPAEETPAEDAAPAE